MAILARMKTVAVAVAALGLLAGAAQAGPSCGKSAAGFDQWKADFAREAAADGVGSRGLSALAGATYATGTIRADRAIHKAFSGSVDSFMKRRGAAAIISRGKMLKKANASLFNQIENNYGVSPGVLLAIWGMETGFGAAMGHQNTVSAIVTLAYDCRRSEFFTGQLLDAIRIVGRGDLPPSQLRGGWAGEIGQTQFLPTPYVRYAVDFDGNGHRDLVHSVPDILASTANFLASHGWQRGGSWQPGSANYGVIGQWNKAEVYQRTIAAMATQLAGGG